MKKLLVLSILIILPFSLSGCFNKEANEEAKQNQESVQTGGGIKVNEPKTIMSWLKSGKGAECEFLSPEGDKITIKTMDGKVLISGMPYADMDGAGQGEALSGYSLTDGDWMYIWGEGKGMKMNLKRMQELAQEPGAEALAEAPETWEDMVETWDEQNVEYKCDEKFFSASEFSVPADVEFSDLSALMEGMADIGEEIQEKMEQGADLDLEALSQQAKDLEAQYGAEE